MKKLFLTFFFCMLTAATLAVSAHAMEDIIRVGLYWGNKALPSANLENDVGSGYHLGWWDDEAFHQLTRVEEENLTVTPSSGGVTVTATNTGKILYRFDGSGGRNFGIMPDGQGENARTWFQGSSWYGGFECRLNGKEGLEIINVVGIDDYVKGVLPYEMSPSWPLEALKAQAVCARTYALWQTRHDTDGFDVCNTTDCQVYQGAGSASELSDRAVEETAGLTAMYGGKFAETYYCSANGGASESSENVWSNPQPYLVGKEDPYERLTNIPDYSYTIRYSYAQLTKLLKDKGYSIGQVTSGQVSRKTPSGNIAEITFRDSAGKTVTLTKEECRWTLNTKSMRFTIDSDGGETFFVNNSATSLSGLSGAYAVTAKGKITALPAGETYYAITSSGTAPLRQSAPSGSGITITGTGWGHGVGMSQYGAKAMAEQGYTYEDILHFYFTGITLERVA